MRRDGDEPGWQASVDKVMRLLTTLLFGRVLRDLRTIAPFTFTPELAAQVLREEIEART